MTRQHGYKYALEFGVRGGQWTKLVIPTKKLAINMAADLQRVFKDIGGEKMHWHEVGKGCPRMTWQSSTHFVALTILDGELRGGCRTLWKKKDSE